MIEPTPEVIEAFAAELRKWWSFDDRQFHTHSWHTREDFIKEKLPELLAALRLAARREVTEAMVERSAEAMCNEVEYVKPPGTIWGLKSLERRAMYRRYARAALTAALNGE